MQNEHTDPSGRARNTTILLPAPVETVWEVWTKPEHIKHWWGPNGFTNTIHKMHVEPAGEWIFTMHGPDGKSYFNKTIFREVVYQQRLVHEHFDPNFLAMIQFENKGYKTLVHWYKLYESKELFSLVEIQYKANEGLQQTVKRLEQYLSQFMTSERPFQ